MCLHHLVQNQKSPLSLFFNVATRKFKIASVTHHVSIRQLLLTLASLLANERIRREALQSQSFSPRKSHDSKDYFWLLYITQNNVDNTAILSTYLHYSYQK